MYKQQYHIGELNCRPIFENWTYSQDSGGGTLKTLANSFYAWAKIEDRTGGFSQAFASYDWKYDVKVVVRYNENIVSSSTFVWQNHRYLINELSISGEAKKRFMIIRATKVEGQLVTTGIITPTGLALVYNYTATGGESSFSDVSLINKTIFGAFKDGAAKEIIFVGSPDPDQVLYTPSTGTFLWGAPFYTDEKAIIQYI